MNLINKRHIALNAMSNWMILFLNMGFSLIAAPLYIRYLGASQLGIMHLIAGLTTQFVIFDFGIGNASVRYTAESRSWGDEKRIQEVFSSSLLIYIIIGCTVLLVGFTLSLFLDRIFTILPEYVTAAKTFLRISTLTVALNFFKYPWVGFLGGFQEYRYMNVLRSTKLLLSIPGILIILISGHQIVALALLTLSLELITLPFYVMKQRKVSPELKYRVSLCKRETLLLMLKFSAFTFLAIISQRLFDNFDDIVIGAFVTTQAVAVYHYGFILMDYIKKLVGSLNNVLLPVATTLHDTNEQDRLFRMFILVSRFSFYLAAPIIIIMMFYGKEFYQLWLGDTFTESYSVFMILAIPNLFVIAISSGVQTLYASGKHRNWSIFQLINAFCNLGLSLVLVNVFDRPILGVAIGTAIPLSCYYLFMQYYYGKHLNFRMTTHFLEVYLKSWPALICIVASSITLRHLFFPDSLILLAAEVATVGTLYMVVLYLMVLKREEKLFFFSKLARGKNRA